MKTSSKAAVLNCSPKAAMSASAEREQKWDSY